MYEFHRCYTIESVHADRVHLNHAKLDIRQQSNGMGQRL